MADLEENMNKEDASREDEPVPDGEINEDSNSMSEKLENISVSLEEDCDITDILNLKHDIAESERNPTEFKSHPSKQKHRSRVTKKKSKPVKKRKWRPLWKLTCKERDKVKEREHQRIQRDRDALLAAGAAFAPHNTTGFLVNDRGLRSPGHYGVFGKSFEEEFEEDYENYYRTFLEKLPKFDLIERWIDAEDRIEVLEKQLNAVREQKRLLGLSGIDVDSEMAKIEVFKEEINKLIMENARLEGKNIQLQKYVSEI